MSSPHTTPLTTQLTEVLKQWKSIFHIQCLRNDFPNYNPVLLILYHKIEINVHLYPAVFRSIFKMVLKDNTKYNERA